MWFLGWFLMMGKYVNVITRALTAFHWRAFIFYSNLVQEKCMVLSLGWIRYDFVIGSLALNLMFYRNHISYYIADLLIETLRQLYVVWTNLYHLYISLLERLFMKLDVIRHYMTLYYIIGSVKSCKKSSLEGI